MLVVDRIEYDVYDFLMINKELTDGKNIGLGINPDIGFVTLVDIDSSEIILEKPLVLGKELDIVFEILDEVYSNTNIDDDILTEFSASYIVNCSV